MTTFKDTQFLHASARVKSMEKSMLGARKLAQMVEANTIDEAYKIVNDAGIGVGTNIAEYEQALKDNLLETYRLLTDFAGGADVFDLFRYEHDGLNVKALVKAQALDKDPEPFMTALGTVPADALREDFKKGRYDKLPPAVAEAAKEALDVLARTGDPQAVDILLDKGVLTAMHQTACRYDNKFIRKYVTAKIDISNIRCMVRIHRVGGDKDFLKKTLSPGGTIGESSILEAYAKGMDAITAFLEASVYGTALEPALAGLRTGETLALFEKLCDNYMVRLLDEARLVPFGIEPLITYLCAKENEIKAARIVLASRIAGVDPEQIKERLRESYA